VPKSSKTTLPQKSWSLTLSPCWSVNEKLGAILPTVVPEGVMVARQASIYQPPV
jgi:hypothetical protein